MEAEHEARYTIALDIRYGMCYNHMQARLLSRLDKCLKITEVLLGSTAFVSFINGRAEFAGIAGLLLAIITAVKFAVDFGELAEQAQTQRRRFADLLLIADSLPLDPLRGQLMAVQSGDAPAIESLRLPAYNRNLVEQGRAECVADLSWRERVMQVVA